MFSTQNRRNFLRMLAGGTAAFTLARRVFSAAGDSPITAERITDNLTILRGTGGNITVLSNSEGLLLIDGSLPETATDLMKFLDERCKGQRIAAAFNTDWHLEHTGSNEALRKAGAKIIAHENTKLW